MICLFVTVLPGLNQCGRLAPPGCDIFQVQPETAANIDDKTNIIHCS